VTPAEAEVAALLRALAARPPAYPGHRSGRGIVMCAGGPRLFTSALVTLNVLRRTLGCTLPVQVWHLGPAEMGPVERGLLAGLDVEVVDAERVRRDHPARILGGWELKPYALTHTRFREVLLLDADNVPVVDPGTMFAWPAYRETGAVFWPDLDAVAPDSGLWALCGLPHRAEPAWESGQVLLDVARCWDALQLTLQMNMHSDVVYAHAHGDKETFHMAWRMLDRPHGMVPHPPAVVPVGLGQRDFAGDVVFQHRTIAKFAFAGETPRCAGFRFEDECRAYLGELRSAWGGRISTVPDRDAGDLAAERRVAATPWWTRTRPGEPERSLELLAGNRVGGGASDLELTWWVRGDRLHLAGRDGELATFAPEGDGWRAPDDGTRLRPATGADAADPPVAALLAGLAAGDLGGGEAEDALVALARVMPLQGALGRARARWRGREDLTGVLERAAARAGDRDPSFRRRGGAHRHVPAPAPPPARLPVPAEGDGGVPAWRLRFRVLGLTVAIAGDDPAVAGRLDFLVQHADQPGAPVAEGRWSVHGAVAPYVVREDGAPPAGEHDAGAVMEHLFHRIHARALALAPAPLLWCGVAGLGERRALLVGPPGAGISTLLVRLLHRGGGVEGDRLALLQDGGVTPVPRPVHLRWDARVLLPELADVWGSLPVRHGHGGGDLVALHPDRFGVPWRIRSGPVDAVVAVEPVFGAGSRLLPVPQHELARLLTGRLAGRPEHPAAAVAAIARIVAGARPARLRLGGLDAAADAVLDLLARD